MEGHTLRPRRALQVLRDFAPNRLTEDLLAGVYERLFAVAARVLTDGPSPVLGRTGQALLGNQDPALTTGGRT